MDTKPTYNAIEKLRPKFQELFNLGFSLPTHQVKKAPIAAQNPPHDKDVKSFICENCCEPGNKYMSISEGVQEMWNEVSCLLVICYSPTPSIRQVESNG